MTIEIRQLVIRAIVEGNPHLPGGAQSRGALVGPGGSTSPPGPKLDERKIVATCVREVLSKLERARER